MTVAWMNAMGLRRTSTHAAGAGAGASLKERAFSVLLLLDVYP